jgi:hypothetical protein
MSVRTVIHITKGPDIMWRATIEGFPIDVMRLKHTLIRKYREQLRKLWKIHRIEGQLIVHKEDGQIAFESTYGNDPVQTKG